MELVFLKIFNYLHTIYTPAELKVCIKNNSIQKAEILDKNHSEISYLIGNNRFEEVL